MEIAEKTPDSDEYYMGIAFAVRKRANCTGNRVGAVIVKGNRVISTGYNGVPEGMVNCLDGGCLRCTNPGGNFPSGTGYDLCICVHAEQNALLSAARFGISVEGATLYSTMQPCFGCAKEIAQTKIEKVIYLHPWIPSDVDEKMSDLKRHEYDKIMAKISIKKIDMRDSEAKWANSSLRKKQ
jgi:dCMP deaminase